MSRVVSLALIPIAALTLAVLPGCEGLGQPSEAELAVQANQAAISSYSDQVPTVDTLQKAFVESWSTVNEIKDVKAFREAVEGEVIPALERYVSALGAMPTEQPELATIHIQVTEAYGTALEGFRVFAKDLEKDSIEERYQRLLGQMERVGKAEASYRDQLRTYYGTNRVRLVMGDKKALAPAPPANAPVPTAAPAP